MRALLFTVVAIASCGPAATIAPSAPHPVAATTSMIDTTPKERRRLLPPETYLRAYLTWFGGLAPLDVQVRARGKNLFDTWGDYVAALGLPDDAVDVPRATQSNTLMLATLGRLGEALCARAAEHDLHGATAAPLAQRIVFAFELTKKPPTAAEFAERLDVLHRTFLGYPLALAPAERAPRYYQLYRAIAEHHSTRKKASLTADESAWAAVCGALILHPETELY